jgi:hypothetical protein
VVDDAPWPEEGRGMSSCASGSTLLSRLLGGEDAPDADDGAGERPTMGTGAVSCFPSRGGENDTGRYSSLSHGNLEFLKWSFSASRP